MFECGVKVLRWLGVVLGDEQEDEPAEIRMLADAGVISAQFAVSSLVSAALFWIVLGGVSGFFYQRMMLSSETQPQPAS